MVAMFALGATIASAAQAEGRFGADIYPTDPTGTSVGQISIFQAAGTHITECSGSFPGTELEGPSAQLQIAPEYSGCSYDHGAPVKLVSNGCTYAWAISKLTGTSTADGTETINCPAGKEFKFIRYESKSKEEAGVPLCEYGMPAQGPLGGSEYSKLGSGSTAHINLDWQSNVKANVLKGPKVVCGGAVGESIILSFVGSIELTATHNYSQNGLTFGPGDVYLAGEKSAEPSKQPRIESESLPTLIGGNQDAASPHLLDFGGVRKISCGGVHLAGEVAGPVSQLPLSAEYSGCTAAPSNLPSTVSMNSCHYTLHVLNVGPPYAGSVDVACSKEGDAIETKIYENKTKQEQGITLCVYKVGAQSGLEGVGLETGYYGSIFRGVKVSLGLKGATFSVTQGHKMICGVSGSNLSYTGATTLYGV
jgi:hypothetical protein